MNEAKKSNESLEKSVELENGLSLDIWVKSKVMAGDRWKISVSAQVDIPVEEAFLEQDEEVALNTDEIRELLGKSVRFEKKMERFFIDEKEKDMITEEIMNSLLESLFPYLSHPEFGKRFIKMEFNRAQQKQV